MKTKVKHPEANDFKGSNKNFEEKANFGLKLLSITPNLKQ